MLKIVQERIQINTQTAENLSLFALNGEKFRIENDTFSIAKEIEKSENLDPDFLPPPQLDFKKTSSSEDEPEYDKVGVSVNFKSYFKGPKSCSDEIIKENKDWLDIEGLLKFEINKIEGAKDAINKR